MKLGSSLGFATIIIARWPWSIRIGDSFFKATGGFTLAFCNSEWPPCSPPGSGPAGASGGEAVGRRQAPWDTNCPSELKTPGSHQTGKCEAHGAPSSSHQKAPPLLQTGGCLSKATEESQLLVSTSHGSDSCPSSQQREGVYHSASQFCKLETLESVKCIHGSSWDLPLH